MSDSGSGRTSHSVAEAVVIVVVSYGRADDVLRCVGAVARSTRADYEVVIVENAGPQAFERLSTELAAGGSMRAPTGADPQAIAAIAGAGDGARRARSFRLCGGQAVTAIEAAGNLGYGGGINVALAAIGGRDGWRGVWVVNPDTEPEPEALAQLVDYTETGGYGLVGCRVVFKGSGLVQTRGGTWRRWIGRGLGLGIGDPRDAAVDVQQLEQRLDWISGAAMYATRAFIERVGPMDDRYFLYCEDVDWSLRRGAFRLGYAHEAIVPHEHGTTIGSSVVHGARSALSIYLTERNRLLLTRRHYPRIYPVVVGLCLAGLGQSYLVKGNWSGFATGFKGWLAGVRGEIGPPPEGAV